jgi:hypothetical protein
MSVTKYNFECSVCGNKAAYNRKRLKRGICVVCEVELTPEQRQGISEGIDGAKEEREITRAVAFLKGKGK